MRQRILLISSLQNSTPFKRVRISREHNNDVDDEQVTVTVTLSTASAGSLSTGGGSVYNASTGIWFLSATSVTDANTALAQMNFTPSANYDLDATAEVVVEDADGLVSSGTITFDVDPVNDTPSGTNLTQTVTYTEDDTSADLTDIVSEVDTIQASLDDGTSETVSVAITLSDLTAGSFSVDSGSGESFSAGVWSISNVSTTLANAALADIAFLPTANYDVDTTAEVVVTDADGASINENNTLTNDPVNDIPSATNLDQTLTYTEGDPSVAIDDIVITEVDTIQASLDDGNPETVTVTVTLSDETTGALSTTEGGSFDSATGIWSITSTSMTTINTALADMAFIPTTNNDLDITADVVVEDADGLAIEGTLTINVTPVNDAPTATNLTQSLSFTEDDASMDIDDIVISEVDTWVSTLDDGTLEQITATLTISDASAGSLSTRNSGSESYNASTEIWTIVATTVSDVNDALADVQYLPATDWEYDFTISVSLEDSGSENLSGTISVSATPVNDAPYFSSDLTDLTSIQKTIRQTIGDQLLDIVGDSIADVDNGAVEGVIVYNPQGNGTWQYSTDQSSWTNVSDSISGGKVLHLVLTNYLRYVHLMKTMVKPQQFLYKLGTNM